MEPMKLEVSTKTSNFGKRPHIRKGYYPARLVHVDEYKDKEGKPKQSKFGRQLIFRFAVYSQDQETGNPVRPMEFTPDESTPNVKKEVELSKFVYHIYKDKKTGEEHTAVTPNSAITALLKALGWEFNPEGVDLSSLIGNWVEINVNDYETGVDGDKYIASTVEGVGPFNGKVPEHLNAPIKDKEEENNSVEEQELGELSELEKQKRELLELHKKNLLSDEALEQALKKLEQ